MDKALLSSIIDTAQKVAASFIPGAAPAIAAVQSAKKLLTRAKELAGPQDQSKLDNTLDELAELVENKADAESARLRGG